MPAHSAIIVENLSKRYVIAHQRPSDTLRDALSAGVRGLWKSWRGGKTAKEDFWALRGVNFEVNRGEVVGIIGRNGAGKSTLLKVLSRITDPTLGRITLNGRIASLLEVGTGFHPELSGRENIFLNGAILGMGKLEIQRKFDEIVSFAEVERFLDTPVKRYSSGMYVRLAFAVAAHLEPEILIIDEVLAVGDAVFQKKCLNKIRDIVRSTDRSVLFVSHNLQTVQKLCTHGVVLNAGQSAGKRPIREALATYLELQRAANIELNQPGATQRLTISGARMLAADESRLETGATQELELSVVSPDQLSFIRLTIAFNNSDGVRVFALDSASRGELLELKPGLNRVRVSFTCPHLFRDTYSLDVGCYSRDGGTLQEAFAVNYFGAVDTSGNEHTPSRGFGIVRVDSTWTGAPG